MGTPLKINTTRLNQRLEQLATIGALENGGVSRLALSDADRQARDLFVSWMLDLGLTVHVDRVGNILGIYPGQADLAPIMLGSHLDTVTVAGRYDGSYGVIAALECVQTLKENGIQPHHPVGIIAFTNEEGVRYTPGMLGSTAYCGELSEDAARSIKGFDGSNFGEELERIGYAGDLPCGAIQPHAFIELHIEQGPILDMERVSIGAVDTVTGITWLEITINGAANHAGTTPTALRRDAGLAAAKIIEHLRELAVLLGENQRATCGMIAFEPNAINVIPSKATLTIDLRNPDDAALKQAEEGLVAFAKDVEKTDGVTIAIHPLEHVLPVEFDPAIVGIIEQTASELGIPHRRMVSGAGHDAQLMAQVCPTAMIFVPSQGGISHSPKEYTSPAELGIGAEVLLHSLLKLVE